MSRDTPQDALVHCHDVRSLCPVCLGNIDGEVVGNSATVVMKKRCPEHGAFESVVSTDLATYERIRSSPRVDGLPASYAIAETKNGCPDDCGLCPLHDQHTCLAIIEITSRCNLPCPVCLANSTSEGADLTVAQVTYALERLLVMEGAPVPVQFGGGEPTMHRELPAMIRTAKALGFAKIEIDSNGLLLANRPGLARELRRAGLSGVYLQMDGLAGGAHQAIRGADILGHKLKAIQHCREAGLQVVLSVTVVPGVNDHCLWDMIRFAADEHLTGIAFQPVVFSGRYPGPLVGDGRRVEKYTSAHFMRAIETQSGGLLRGSELMPVPCDPRCGLLTYAVVTRTGEIVPLQRLVGDRALLKYAGEFADWDKLLRDLTCATSGCCCGGEDRALADLARLLDGAECFSIGFHGMMDAFCFDRARAQRCCVHKLTPEGRLMPFCLYNMKYRPAEQKAARSA